MFFFKQLQLFSFVDIPNLLPTWKYTHISLGDCQYLPRCHKDLPPSCVFISRIRRFVLASQDQALVGFYQQEYIN